MGGEANQGLKSIDLCLPSTLESVDVAEQQVLEAAREAGLSDAKLHEVSMAVREVVVNAIVHGNRYSAHKKVRLQVFREKDRIRVSVTDEGEGFDLESLPDPLAEENLLHQSGRGLLLVRSFVDEFQVRKLSPGGMEVTLVKYAQDSA